MTLPPYSNTSLNKSLKKKKKKKRIRTNLCILETSLLNDVNAKIIAKALACCLENIAQTIVSQKQTRFAPVRQLFLHLCTLKHHLL